MKVDRQRARRQRRGKADARFRASLERELRRRAAGELWTCPQCGTRAYRLLDARMRVDSVTVQAGVKGDDVIRVCRNGHAYKQRTVAA